MAEAVASAAPDRLRVMHVRADHAPAVIHEANVPYRPLAQLAAAVRALEHEHPPQLPIGRIARPEAEERLDDARPDGGEPCATDDGVDAQRHRRDRTSVCR